MNGVLHLGLLYCSVVTMDSACDSKTAAGNAVRMHIEEDVDVFIGPACSVGRWSSSSLKISVYTTAKRDDVASDRQKIMNKNSWISFSL